MTISPSPRREPPVAELLAELGLPTGASYLDLLRSMARRDPASPAVEFHDRAIDYGELLSMVAGAAAHLEDVLGVCRGTHVAYMVRGHPNALALYLAVVGSGAVLVPVYNEYDGGVLQAMLDRLDVEVLVIDPEFAPRIDALSGRPTTMRHVVELHGSQLSAAIEGGGEIERLLGRDDPTAADPALILSTSGTTGLPKGVVMRNAFAGAGFITLRKWGVDLRPKSYICSSWGHGMVQYVSGVAFWFGGSVVLAERFSASGYWDDVRRHGVNHVHLLGTMPRMLYDQPPRPDDHDHAVELCVSSGMPRDLWSKFEDRFGVTLREQYGSTDGGGAFMTNPGWFPAGSVGRPWMEAEARIVDEVGNEVGDEAVGELHMRPVGGAAVVEYYADPEASAEKVVDGWVATGDNFRRDRDGNYWFVDRARDVIRRRGINLAPALIEDALRTHPGVADVAAFGVPASIGEDDIKVAVVAPGMTAAEVAAVAGELLPRNMRPRYVELVAELPLTVGTQRVQRFKLRDGWRTSATWDTECDGFLSPSV